MGRAFTAELENREWKNCMNKGLGGVCVCVFLCDGEPKNEALSLSLVEDFGLITFPSLLSSLCQDRRWLVPSM